MAIGIGMGGFVDGIVAHQLLQIHSMISNRLPPDTVVNLEINMFWDGVFHGFTWLMTAFGIWLLWRAVKQPGAILSGRVLFGSIILGWGVFNLVEGLLDHHILQLHHVVQRGDHLFWDVAFLISGVVLTAAGLLIRRRGIADAP
jgi:uncharacterized membrane protein